MIYIFNPEIIDLMGKVEGERWARDQRTDRSNYGVAAFVKAWSDLQEALAEYPDMTWQDNVRPEAGDGAIYGEGGYARYIVKHDGEVVLLRWSTRPERCTLAERVGFSTK